jgi:hypothetical protein
VFTVICHQRVICHLVFSLLVIHLLVISLHVINRGSSGSSDPLVFNSSVGKHFPVIGLRVPQVFCSSVMLPPPRTY